MYVLSSWQGYKVLLLSPYWGWVCVGFRYGQAMFILVKKNRLPGWVQDQLVCDGFPSLLFLWFLDVQMICEMITRTPIHCSKKYTLKAETTDIWSVPDSDPILTPKYFPLILSPNFLLTSLSLCHCYLPSPRLECFVSAGVVAPLCFRKVSFVLRGWLKTERGFFHRNDKEYFKTFASDLYKVS